MHEISEKKGRLIVFEGVDGVGKTTLSSRLADYLTQNDEKCIYLAFPGQKPLSLGKHIHNLHHRPTDYGIESIHPVSLQMLHVAAHIDAIENTIKPCLEEGYTIILDRFWWSTKAYGIWSGINKTLINRIISIELECLDGLSFDILFYIERPCVESNELLCEIYEDIFKYEKSNGAYRIKNDKSLDVAFNKILIKIGKS